jgi:hypothetical protein
MIRAPPRWALIIRKSDALVLVRILELRQRLELLLGRAQHGGFFRLTSPGKVQQAQALSAMQEPPDASSIRLSCPGRCYQPPAAHSTVPT